MADDDERDAAFLTSLTTEHFGLAGARSTTVSESAGRSALFLASVSSTLIALGFVAQVADETFRLFALSALPILAFLGLATFVRVLENSIEDLFYARAIGRIRQYYVEQAGPERSHYFMLEPGDSIDVALRNMAVEPGRWQIYFTNQAMVSVVNSAVIGGGLAIAGGALGLSDEVAVAVGVAALVVSVVLHQRYAAAPFRAQRAGARVAHSGVGWRFGEGNAYSSRGVGRGGAGAAYRRPSAAARRLGERREDRP